jgi:hypothetical protein
MAVTMAKPTAPPMHIHVGLAPRLSSKQRTAKESRRLEMTMSLDSILFLCQQWAGPQPGKARSVAIKTTIITTA